ncbi:hypothetical protein RI367_001248 [Sorochytrium milnesiophthora]
MENKPPKDATATAAGGATASPQYLSNTMVHNWRRTLRRADVWNEVAILTRVMYKSTSQMRRMAHFKRLVELQRYLKRLRLFVKSALRQAQKVSAPQQQENIEGQRQPLRSVVACRQQRDLFVLLLATIPIIAKAHYHLTHQMSEALFMPFCLTTLASIARIRLLFITWIDECAHMYSYLRKTLPMQRIAHGELPAQLKYDPTTFQPILTPVAPVSAAQTPAPRETAADEVITDLDFAPAGVTTPPSSSPLATPSDAPSTVTLPALDNEAAPDFFLAPTAKKANKPQPAKAEKKVTGKRKAEQQPAADSPTVKASDKKPKKTTKHSEIDDIFGF